MERAAIVIDQCTRIAAPAAVVWQVIVDLDRYPEWNPFVLACHSTLAVGAPIDMRVRLLPVAMMQRETILEHVPGERLCYGLRGGFAGGVQSQRCHVVHAAGDGTAEYESRFALSGRLAPVVRALLGKRLERGFGSMTEALVHRAESIARGERSR